MTASEIKAIIEEQAALSGMSPEDLTRKTMELVGVMGSTDIGSLVAEQMKDFAAAVREISEQTKSLQERMRNGTRRTVGSVRLPV